MIFSDVESNLFDMDNTGNTALLGNKLGMRLKRVEVYNWGAYDGTPYAVFTPNRENTMIYGNSGSGKTTLLDALITLLIPPRKRKYNKAAEADSKRDRNFTAYIRGTYAPNGTEEGSLRDDSSTSSLLAVFSDTYNRVLSIAQVIYKSGTEWKTIYVTSDKELTIEGDLSGCTGANDLRNKLRSNGAKTYDTFTEYQETIRLALGIKKAEDLVLWMKAAYMKNVASVDAFVKENMLEDVSLYGRMKEAVDTLTKLRTAKQAKESMQKRIKLLEGIVKDGNTCLAYDNNIRDLEARTELISPWCIWKTGEKAKAHVTECIHQLKDVESFIEDLSKESNNKADTIRKLEIELAQNGGNRQQELQKEINGLRESLSKKEMALDNLNKRLSFLHIPEVHTHLEFNAMRNALPELKSRLEKDYKEKQEAKENTAIRAKEVSDELSDLKQAVEELSKHPDSNIPYVDLEVRKQICRELQIPEAKLPYAGELMQVSQKGKEAGWEGALENLLHPLSMVLLVRKELYEKVAAWVDDHKKIYRNRPGGKIKYMVVNVNTNELAKREDDGKVHAYDYINIKEESIFYGWLWNRLTKVGNNVCCETMAEFRAEAFALTKNGQIKKHGNYHEKKDFGNRASDQYVLGYNNKEKIFQYKDRIYTLNSKLNKINEEKQHLGTEMDALTDKQNVLYMTMKANVRFEDIDAEFIHKQLLAAEDELKELEKKDPENKRLKAHIDELKEVKAQLDSKIQKASERKGGLDKELNGHKYRVQQGEEAAKVLDANSKVPKEELEEAFYRGAVNVRTVDTDTVLYVQAYEEIRRILDKQLSEQIIRRRSSRLDAENAFKEKAKEYMGNPKYQDNELVNELVPDVRALETFKELYDFYRNQSTNRLVNVLGAETIEIPLRNARSTINALESAFHMEIRKIKDKITKLNETLGKISYGDHRHIQLECSNSTDDKILAFKEDLHSFNSYINAVETTDIDLDVNAKAIFDKRVDAFVDAYNCGGDKAMERKVAFLTNPGNHLHFTVRITDDATGQSHVYEDTSSRSGGEKECMAYTMIAAALNYSFNLSANTEQSQSFRVLCIDEAFSKCSLDFVRQCMDLFNKFNLQVILITPTDKRGYYMEYVKGTAHVAINPTTHKAQLKMEYYKEEKDA